MQPIAVIENNHPPNKKMPEKWCEIHHTTGHDLEECRTYLNCKMMPKKLAAQKPHRGEHRGPTPTSDEINIIFRGSLSIASKTQVKELEKEISLAQCIELGRRMMWSKIDISFGPKIIQR
jgi:hypothetical protein